MRSISVCVLLIATSMAFADETKPRNLDLEEGELGEVPAGWFLPEVSEAAGYSAVLAEANPKAGKRCAELSRKVAGMPQGFGNLMQSFDAKDYRGQRVRLRAWVRANLTGDARAQLWLRVDRPGGKPGFFDNMGDRPITKREWTQYEIIGDVDEDAETINIGLMLIGNGVAGLDVVAFEAIGKKGEGNEPPRPLTERGLANLTAFARLYGYVRFFHPSDEAAAADWERFLIEGVAAVEPAKDAAELAAALQRLFAPLAPTVRVHEAGQAPPPEPLPPAAMIMYWKHTGVGLGNTQGPYMSLRIEAKPSAKLPSPAEPFTADLGGGVACVVPLAVPHDGNRTLPAAAAKLVQKSTKPENFRPSGDDRTTRLANVIIAWNVFQHFYPYFDVVKTDWPGELSTALNRAAVDADQHAFLRTLRRLVAALHDGHGRVSLDAAGATVPLPLTWDWIEGKLVVTHVAGPLAADVQRGDVIVRIDGKPASTCLEECEAEISGATPQWRRWRALEDLRLGPPDSSVLLNVQRRPGVVKSVKAERLLQTTDAEPVREPRPEPVEEIRPGIMYVDLDRIDDKAFAAALPKLNEATGIIFDLRGYPSRVGVQPISHLIAEPVTCAQWHIPATLRPDREGMTFNFSNWKVPPKEPKWKAKAAFITDGRAVSYAETYLGIIEHYKLAEIVGAATAGTNGNVNPFRLPGGYMITWTGMKVFKHDGSVHHGVGIQPTIPVQRTIAGAAAGTDEFLEAAIKAVSR